MTLEQGLMLFGTLLTLLNGGVLFVMGWIRSDVVLMRTRMHDLADQMAAYAAAQAKLEGQVHSTTPPAPLRLRPRRIPTDGD